MHKLGKLLNMLGTLDEVQLNDGSHDSSEIQEVRIGS